MCRMTSEAVRKSMQGNKRCDTKPELLVRARLRAAGLTGYRLQWKVPGHPDVAWPGKRVALFINGCFWHRCPRCQPRVPKTNVEYWVLKFERNVERDERTHAQLEEMGWRVHVVWECELKKKTIDDTMARLLPQLADELGKKLVVPDGEDGSSRPPCAARTKRPSRSKHMTKTARASRSLRALPTEKPKRTAQAKTPRRTP